MSQTLWGRIKDRVRSHRWWPVHYRTDDSSWWAWRGKYYFYRKNG